MVSGDWLHALFRGACAGHADCAELGLDTEVAPAAPEEAKDGGEAKDEEEEQEEKEEEEEAEEAKPTPPKEWTRNAWALFELLAGGAAELDWPLALTRLQLATRGYGEASLRFALSAADGKGIGAVPEALLWRALQACASRELSAAHRAHLRRAWRAADKNDGRPPATEEEEEKEEEEEEKDEEDEDEEAREARAQARAAAKRAREEAREAKRRREEAEPREPHVVVDAWLEKLTEDALLAEALLADVPVPSEDAPADDASASEEDE